MPVGRYGVLEGLAVSLSLPRRGLESHEVDIGHKIPGRTSLSRLLAEKGEPAGPEYFAF